MEGASKLTTDTSCTQSDTHPRDIHCFILLQILSEMHSFTGISGAGISTKTEILQINPFSYFIPYLHCRSLKNKIWEFYRHCCEELFLQISLASAEEENCIFPVSDNSIYCNG